LFQARHSLPSTVKRGEARAVSTHRHKMENLLTVKEVAALLRVSAQTLYKMLEQGDIPAVKVGSQWRFDREKIRAWIDSRAAESKDVAQKED
jgi:excisionase family DNA binding protein